MTFVHCRVEDKLSAFIKTTPSCIQKKKLKLHFSIRTHTTWPWFSVSTSPSKVSSRNSWKTAQLSKMICNNSLWQSNDLSAVLCHQSFLVQCVLSTYWKLFWFLESIFSMIFKPQNIWWVYSIQKLRHECLSLFLLL